MLKIITCLIFATAINVSFYTDSVSALALSKKQCQKAREKIFARYFRNKPSVGSSEYGSWLNSMKAEVDEFVSNNPECSLSSTTSTTSVDSQQEEHNRSLKYMYERMCIQGSIDACRKIGDVEGARSARKKVCRESNLKYDAATDTCY
ncbi:hypothetical protein [Chamaesiphon polymorphus]|uniref:Uncharacterized protein n=1 Tax=Chamaesiphon polymorphus CCALA 037 TaxID=2107692 RepID=A0A2T1GFW7_9CYAN|nr:hypothetical protein [Chamaesiphon polymorphus]PSB56467.1 hypothetical protein C7B77_11780 [Chamaesiphon polymorphus CCALA 037]